MEIASFNEIESNRFYDSGYIRKFTVLRISLGKLKSVLSHSAVKYSLLRTKVNDFVQSFAYK